ncbi:MAG: hypothetical protein HYR85_17175 [Planctomycetes bacterium]|nr:hypothetical protein [Planctomycetota bacterium]MBI3845373.1 hypothetical protein [Planctomycetota bacterium]
MRTTALALTALLISTGCAHHRHDRYPDCCPKNETVQSRGHEEKATTNCCDDTAAPSTQHSATGRQAKPAMKKRREEAAVYSRKSGHDAQPSQRVIRRSGRAADEGYPDAGVRYSLSANNYTDPKDELVAYLDIVRLDTDKNRRMGDAAQHKVRVTCIPSNVNQFLAYDYFDLTYSEDSLPMHIEFRAGKLLGKDPADVALKWIEGGMSASLNLTVQPHAFLVH